MYGQHDNYYGTAASISVGHNHRFNPNAPAFRAGSGSTFGGAASGTFQQPSVFEGYGAAEYTPHPMNAAALMMADQPRVVAANLHSNDAHQTSFGSSNNSFSGPSTPAMAGMPSSSGASKRNRYTHNPYASSNASNSEPSSPAVAPAVPPRGGVAPMADAAFFNSMSSNGTSAPQSPVYAPNDANLGVYGDAASHHPIAFSINEQFAQARGSLAAAACTPRGRHLIVGALRQQHTDKIQAVFEEIAPNVAAVVMDGQGGHVVRTLIEFLNEMQVAQLVEYLTPEVVLTIATSSQNTRRVLQTLFERHRTPALQPVVDVIATHAIALSTTQQGCIAVMRCIEHTSECQKTQVLLALQPQLAALTMDPYGNYVAQAVLQYFPRETACEVIEKAFHGHWVNLSCNKFASNVMEKFIQAATPMTRKTILDELVFSTEALGALMQDGFGNFVLQQIIDTCTTGPEYRKLVDKVRPQLPSSPFGHKIEAKLKAKRFGPPYEGAARETTNAPSPQSGTSSSGAGAHARQAGKPRRDGENTTAGQRRGAGGSGGKPSSFSSKPLDAIDAKASVSSRSGSAVSTGSAPVTAE